jgi:hypothetical protein
MASSVNPAESQENSAMAHRIIAESANYPWDEKALKNFQECASEVIPVRLCSFHAYVRHQIPASLYFFLLTKKIQLTGDRAILVLVLI